MRPAQNVRCFRHEMNAAEYNKFPVFEFRRIARKFERIAIAVSELDDVVALIVMAKNDDLIAQFFLQRVNAPHNILGGCFRDERIFDTTPCPLLEKEGVFYHI